MNEDEILSSRDEKEVAFLMGVIEALRVVFVEGPDVPIFYERVEHIMEKHFHWKPEETKYFYSIWELVDSHYS